MRVSSILATTTALLSSASAAENYLGFNSGATKVDRSAKFKEDFVAEFTTAQNLANAPGTFNAVRLYTNIQAYSDEDPISAFEAAIETKTYLLLGIWTSGTTTISKELNALQKALTTYGSKLTDLVIGISIGSEDLYRNSATGVANKAGIGAQPDTIVGFINEFRKTFANTPLGSIPVGHVDTWDVWGNATNKPVLDAIDFIGVDEYPYYENGKGNNIKNSGQLFDRAYDATIAAAGGKPVWVTETGWPSSGPAWDQAEAGVENAKYYWNEIGCRRLFNKVPTFWYNLRDSNPDNEMKFAITENLSTTPLFDLTCPTTFETPENDGTIASNETSSDSTSSTGTGSAGGSGSGSGSTPGSGSGSSPTSGSSANPSASDAANAGVSGFAFSAVTTAALALVAGAFALA